MRSNPQLFRINRNFVICFIISASVSAVATQLLGDQENYLNATITIIIGYMTYFGIFSVLFYFDNRDRYKTMRPDVVKKELLALISSFGVGEIIYLGIRWPTLYYFLEIGVEPYMASLISEVMSTACYMASVTAFLRKTRTF